MLGLLKYYWRYIQYKFSFEGEDVDSSYHAKFVFHNGREAETFDFYNPPEGFGTIDNICQSARQLKLEELRQKELRQLKASAKEELKARKEQRHEKKLLKQS